MQCPFLMGKVVYMFALLRLRKSVANIYDKTTLVVWV